MIGRLLHSGVALAVLLATSAVNPTQTPSPAQSPHIMVIVEENRSEHAVIDSGAAPYITSLAARYGLATRSYAMAHPSLPNYLALASGSTFGIRDDGYHVLSAPTLVDQLSAAAVGWRAYMEGMPSACFAGSSSGAYARKHDPFVFFSSITTQPSQCDRVVPFSDFAPDLSSASAPAFMWVTPDVCHDGHSCSTATMDAWLRDTTTMVLTSPWYAEDGTIIITWDEGVDSSGCCGSAQGGNVATLVVSARLATPVRSGAAVDHAGVLRTIEQIYGLPFLGDAACGCSGDIDALFGPRGLPGGYSWQSVPRWR